MVREVKPLEVGEVHHPQAHVRVKVFYSKARKEFQAEWGGVLLQDAMQQRLENRVYEAISDSMKLDWQPIIAVYMLRPFSNYGGTFVGFNHSRFYVAPVGHLWKRTEWETEPADRFERCHEFYPHLKTGQRFEVPITEYYNGGTTYYLPYSDEYWSGLAAIAEQIDRADSALTKILGTPEGLQFLQSMPVVPLLTGGQGQE